MQRNYFELGFVWAIEVMYHPWKPPQIYECKSSAQSEDMVLEVYSNLIKEGVEDTEENVTVIIKVRGTPNPSFFSDFPPNYQISVKNFNEWVLKIIK